MKSTAENLFTRGKAKTFYIRRRIPAALLRAYENGQKEIVRSLHTSNKAEAAQRFRIEQVRIDAEFGERKRLQKQLQSGGDLRHLASLTDDHIRGLAQYWVRSILQSDQVARSNGMDDDEFHERGQSIAEQRDELGKMLAQGKVSRILPAMHGFMHLCGLSVNLTQSQEQNAGFAFLEAVVDGLDHVGARHAGKRIDTDLVAPEVPHPCTIGLAPPAGPDWDKIFENWRDFVQDRPKATIIASQTPWGQLKVFAATRNLKAPAHLTPQHLSEFVEQMSQSGLKVKTINSRLGKLREIFKIAVGKQLLSLNPAEKTLGFKESAAQKGIKRRLPFTLAELNLIFGSSVFTEHLRSSGQSGEASYWIPLIMFYTGARPEEIAGLQLADINKFDATTGWYFSITDAGDDHDSDLFDEIHPHENKAEAEKRKLKNHVSRRNIPIAIELHALGFFRYVEWVRTQGSVFLFPTLQKDFHGKLSGSFSKWFGRYKTELGFKNPKKVLYSLRHNMKDFMEDAKVPSKYLKRILGHASGDGSITDGYGSDVPLANVFEYFNKVRFPVIPAQPWQPGVGYLRKNNVATASCHISKKQ